MVELNILRLPSDLECCYDKKNHQRGVLWRYKVCPVEIKSGLERAILVEFALLLFEGFRYGVGQVYRVPGHEFRVSFEFLLS